MIDYGFLIKFYSDTKPIGIMKFDDSSLFFKFSCFLDDAMKFVGASSVVLEYYLDDDESEDE